MQTEGGGKVAAKFIVVIDIIQELVLLTAPHAKLIIQIGYQSTSIPNMLKMSAIGRHTHLTEHGFSWKAYVNFSSASASFSPTSYPSLKSSLASVQA